MQAGGATGTPHKRNTLEKKPCSRVVDAAREYRMDSRLDGKSQENSVLLECEGVEAGPATQVRAVESAWRGGRGSASN